MTSPTPSTGSNSYNAYRIRSGPELTCFDLELAGSGVDGFQKVAEREFVVLIVQTLDAQ